MGIVKSFLYFGSINIEFIVDIFPVVIYKAQNRDIQSHVTNHYIIYLVRNIMAPFYGCPYLAGIKTSRVR